MARPTFFRVTSLLILAGLCAGVGAVARARYLPDAPILPGLRVDGETVEADGDLRALVEARVALLKARKVKLVIDGEVAWPKERPLLVATLGELGLEVDIEAVVARAKNLGRGEDLLARIELAERARSGDLDVPLMPVVNARVVLARLEPLKEEEDLAPVSARLDLDHHTVVGEKDGRYLDVDAAVAALQRFAESPGYVNQPQTTVAVPMASFKPRVSSAFLSAIDISQVVGSYETSFGRTGGQANRGRNVEVAAARLNGVVLYPGDILSFNGVVGARSLENGFQKAGEIFKGEMIEGVGGGTCQVASTFHAAAFFGGLDILERLPHSRPSAYITLGLDATVVYPSVDLKIKNPYSFPIVVHAFVDGSKIKVELLGKQHPVEVSYGRDVLGTFPFTRKIVEEDWVTKPTLKQKGIKGIQIRRSRVLAFHDGQKRVETSTDLYPPTIEIYRVPPGYNADELPPVGEDPNAEKKPDAPVAQQG